MRCSEALKRGTTLCTLNRRLIAAKFTNFYTVIIFVTLLTTAQAAGRCFVNGPGTSIAGADYRRDYEISLKHCAITCREDQCCMAFEWIADGTCTLKGRSLNGTISNVEGVHFGLCIDTDDADRNRFWDHEVFGPMTGAVSAIDREECADFCSTLPETQMYSWKTSNPRDMDESIDGLIGYNSSQMVGQTPLNVLLAQNLAMSAPVPLLTVGTQNTNAQTRGWSTPPSSPYTSPSDDQRYRRRWQTRQLDLSPTWIPSTAGADSVTASASNPQSNSKIVSVTYADPTGGSTIVTRRLEDGRFDVRFVYSRDFILAASSSPYALLPPPNVKQIVGEMMEIVAIFPTSFFNSIRKDGFTTCSEH